MEGGGRQFFIKPSKCSPCRVKEESTCLVPIHLALSAFQIVNLRLEPNKNEKGTKKDVEFNLILLVLVYIK